jgi:hypothetical protein
MPFRPEHIVRRGTVHVNLVNYSSIEFSGSFSCVAFGVLWQSGISNSSISYNVGNGLNAVSGAGRANMLNLSHNVIASNGAAGVRQRRRGPCAQSLVAKSGFSKWTERPRHDFRSFGYRPSDLQFSI